MLKTLAGHVKEYKKASNAEKLLHSLIEEGEQELVYLDTVIDNNLKKSYHRCLSSFVIFFLNTFALPVNFELLVLFIYTSSTASGPPSPQGEGFFNTACT